jgi:metacaspase-1
MDIFHEDFYLVPPECTGTKRAVLIGINYFGQSGELTGCINDCMNIKDYIINVWGFAAENITVLTDDSQNDGRPTKANILAAYQKVASQAVSGDAVFCHYSGRLLLMLLMLWMSLLLFYR